MADLVSSLTGAVVGSLAGKVALVTGGVSGIGGAITAALLRHGCSVAGTYHRSIPASMGSDATAGTFLPIPADLTVDDQAAATVRTTAEHYGRIDILVNNCGDLVGRRPLANVDPEFFGRVMAVNMDSMLMVTRHAMPHLRDAAGGAGAAVVNVSSLAGRRGGHGGSLAYATAKGAVLTFTRALAMEAAPTGVRVNAVAPGLILGTNFHDRHTTPDSARQTIDRSIPLGRAGTPDEVAEAVVFLAQQYDGFITGATIDVNGGQYMM